jgi:hypothetical protein
MVESSLLCSRALGDSLITVTQRDTCSFYSFLALLPRPSLQSRNSVNLCTNKEISMEMWKSEISIEMFLTGTEFDQI